MSAFASSHRFLFFLVFLFLGSLFFSTVALAGTAVLDWNANAEPDLAGYKIYYDTSSKGGSCPAGYASSVDVGNVTSYTLNDLPEGHVYFFQITALDASGNESGCSVNPGEVSKVITYAADFDINRTVNLFDYNTLLTNYGSSGCGNPADANKDCAVNLFDYNSVLQDYGKSF